ncbi:MAG: glycosyltransferase [Treponema sp.]|nr:glycosyltransferase [Treponema sp.]
MKIAMFSDSYYPRINGVTVSVHSYAVELTKLGHKVAIICLDYTEEQQRASFFDEKKSDAASPFKIIRIPSQWIIWSDEDRFARFDCWRYLKKQVDAFGPDLVHGNGEWSIGYLGAMYARHRRLPFVYTFHTMWEDYIANYTSFITSLIPNRGLRLAGRTLVKFYLKRANLIIAPTKHIAQVVERYGIDRPMEILPTGIPDNKFSKYSIFRAQSMFGTLSRKFPAIKDRKILLYVGRVAYEKNLAFLFDVLKKVQEKEPKACLLMVGGGPYLDELKDRAKECGLEKSVCFTGYVPSKDVLYLYRMSQIFVFPSKTDTQGLVTIESMMTGLPVVAIGELGTVDVMQGDHGGFMVHDDVNEFAEKVTLLLQNPKLRKQKSEESKQWSQQWKISSLTPRLLSCYEKVLAEKKDNKRNKSEEDEKYEKK